jgi:hypothetical protein
VVDPRGREDSPANWLHGCMIYAQEMVLRKALA